MQCAHWREPAASCTLGDWMSSATWTTYAARLPRVHGLLWALGTCFRERVASARIGGAVLSLLLLAAPLGEYSRASGSGPRLYVPPPSASPSISNLGFGPSDVGRLNHMIRSINPSSPLNGRGSLMVSLGLRWRVDPLLIALWQYESGMGTTGINSPNNGGNLTWGAAREAESLHGCARGPSSLGHVWATCPSLSSGLALWFDYVHTYYVKKRGIRSFFKLVCAYNPCSDSAPYGYPCGSDYGRGILRLIAHTAGPPTRIWRLAPPPSCRGSLRPPQLVARRAACASPSA